MGEKLVLTYTQESNPKINAISIFQYKSAYTKTAIETAETINSWIKQFQNTTEFTAMTPHQRFVTFAQALSTGEIIDGALITNESLQIYDKLELKPLVYNKTLINRNLGLIDINGLTTAANWWAEMSNQFDTTEWFNDNPSQPDLEYLPFFCMETLTINVDPDVDPFSLSVKQVIANSDDVENLENILGKFKANLDEKEMPDDYNLSLKEYIEQNAFISPKFYKTIDEDDLEKVIREDDAFNFSHILSYHFHTDYNPDINEAFIQIYYAKR